MNLITQPCCPACGRSVVSILRWAQAMETGDILELDVDLAGRMNGVRSVPTVDVQCGSCGSTVRIGRDAPLAAA